MDSRITSSQSLQGLAISVPLQETSPSASQRGAVETPLFSKNSHRAVSITSPTSHLVTTPPKLLNGVFFDDCQVLVKRFLHVPQAQNPVSGNEIPRLAHGAHHLARTACWIPVLLAWRQKAGDLDAQTFPIEQLPWLMKAALLHDSGREGEGEDQKEWEEQSAQNLQNHLLAIDCPASMAVELGQAILNKNRTEERDEKRKSLLEKLLHDADCLEIMRCRSEFDLNYLDIYDEFKGNPETCTDIIRLATNIRDVIHHQNDMRYDTSIVLSQPEESRKILSSAIPIQYDKSLKYHHEFAENALLHQINWLKKNSPELYQLLCSGVREVPEVPSSQLQVHHSIAVPSSHLPEIIKAPDSEKVFKVTSGLTPQVATHQLLLNRLARALGFKTPECKLHLHNLEQSSLLTEIIDQQNSQSLSELPTCEKARLFLLSSVLGLWNVTEAVSFIDGELVIHDFSNAGLYSKGCYKTDSLFTATPFEVEWFRNPDKPRDAFPESIESMLTHFRKNSTLFSSLTKQDIAQAVDHLSQMPLHEFEQLLERYGPDKALERNQLQMNISERIAFMRRRFPPHLLSDEARIPLVITASEQRAIKASMITGHCLPASPGDIVKGEARLFHVLNEKNQPVTEAWVRLSPEACRKVSDHLGIPPPWHRRMEIIDFYINHAFQEHDQKYSEKEMHRSMVMNDDWKERLSQLIGQCHNWREELILEKSRCPDSIKEIDLTIAAIIKATIDLEKLAKLPAGYPLIIDEKIVFPKLSLQGFPSRVSILPDNGLVSASEFRIRHFDCGRAWEKGQWADINPEKGFDLNKTAVHYFRIPDRKWLPDRQADVEATLCSDDLPDGYSFSGILRLRLQGLNRDTSQTLVDYMNSMGLQISHASPTELQSHYERSLLNCLNPGKSIDAPISLWYDYCRIINGKPTYYRPETDSDRQLEEKDIHTVHAFLNPLARNRMCESKIELKKLDKESNKKLLKIIQNGASVDPFTHRVRKGTPDDHSPWRHFELKCGGTSSSFTGSTKTVEDYREVPYIRTKPLARRRLDAITYNTCHLGNNKPEYVHLYKVLPEQQWEGCARHQNNETFFDELSLEEAYKAKIPNHYVNTVINSINRYTMKWPDGDAFQLKPTPAEKTDFQVTTCIDKNSLPEPIFMLICAAGIKQYERLRIQNPRINEGVIENLDNITLQKGVYISDLNLTDTSLKKTDVSGVEFIECTFNSVDMTHCRMKGARFYNCRASKANITTDQLLETCHFIDNEKDCAEWIEQLKHSQRPLKELLSVAQNNGLVRLSPEKIGEFCKTVSVHSLKENEFEAYIHYLMKPEFSAYLSKEWLAIINDHIVDNLFDDVEDQRIYEALKPGQLRELFKLNPELQNQKFSSFEELHFISGKELYFLNPVGCFKKTEMKDMTVKGDLHGADFSEADLHGTCFSDCNLKGAKLCWSQIEQLHFSNYSLNDRDKLDTVLSATKAWLGASPSADKIKILHSIGLYAFFEC